MSYQMVVDLVAATTTTACLKVYASLYTTDYATKKKVSKEAMQAIDLQPHKLNPQLNYTIAPRKCHDKR